MPGQSPSMEWFTNAFAPQFNPLQIPDLNRMNAASTFSQGQLRSAQNPEWEADRQNQEKWALESAGERQRQGFAGQRNQMVLDLMKSLQSQFAGMGGVGGAGAGAPGLDLEAMLAPVRKMQREQQADLMKNFAGAGREIQGNQPWAEVASRLGSRQAEDIGSLAQKGALTQGDIQAKLMMAQNSKYNPLMQMLSMLFGGGGGGGM